MSVGGGGVGGEGLRSADAGLTTGVAFFVLFLVRVGGFFVLSLSLFGFVLGAVGGIAFHLVLLALVVTFFGLGRFDHHRWGSGDGLPLRLPGGRGWPARQQVRYAAVGIFRVLVVDQRRWTVRLGVTAVVFVQLLDHGL
uniref:(northern house mosquito) hypothetical protein n=1 Tax=Culex pipiens TaxID=7175 RepID=A0A8D8H6S3_CULPI